ncbi:winged helix DNA-binding domain-containing protein [Nocardiopsis ganjiahuensis]|uniref:winged helix DNA-binding domain-containing protein n=1 Tax=Nocardiopsis ganjiahuensis TaxID=239984 RepID=UPI00034C81D7|nr:winged helix DNA-binding domain-containing protein [Nocardiopsis ganjiahuensis]
MSSALTSPSVPAPEPGAASVDWSGQIARRCERHHLSSPGADVAQVVGAMCGAHAQVMGAAEVSVALRLGGVERTRVREALWERREVVKTYGPRGTVHLLPSAELGLWCAGLGAVERAGNPAPKGAVLSPQQVEELVVAAGEVLGEAEMSADELTRALVARVGAWAGEEVMPAFGGWWPRWRWAMRALATRGVMCFGPVRGRTVTFTGVRRWVPDFALASERAGLEHLVGAYLRAYGPVTSAHLARWLAAPLRWTRQLLESLEGVAEPLRAGGRQGGGQRYWRLAGDVRGAVGDAPEVMLLPYFDPYTVGSHPREVLFPGRAHGRALARGQAGNFPVLYLRGRAAGVWHQRRSGSRLQVRVEPVVELTAAQREGVAERVRELGRIQQVRPALSFGPVTVGPHA